MPALLRLLSPLLALALVAAACSSSEPESTTTSVGSTTTEGSTTTADADEARAAVVGMPDSIVGDRVSEILTAALDGSLDAQLVEERFTESFLELVSAESLVTSAGVLPGLLGSSPVVAELTIDTDQVVGGTLVNPADESRWTFLSSTEIAEPRRLQQFTIVPDETPEPADLGELAAAGPAWDELGPEAALLVTEVDPLGPDGCSAEGAEGVGTALDVDAPLAIGSTFKLYVLSAVATAVDEGRLAWTDEVTVDEASKSLPSGILQNEDEGTTLSVADAAVLMLAISDNTATDHLMALVGRDRVEAQQAFAGHHDPTLNQPFPTTRELFQLKLGDPIRLGLFEAADEAERRRLLDELAAEDLPEVSPGSFTEPTALAVEWFATAQDLCRVMVVLTEQAESHPEVGRALAAGSGLAFDARSWPTVWFKGGSEPGVLSLTWLVERGDGRWFVVSGTVNDREMAVDGERALAIMRAVFEELTAAR